MTDKLPPQLLALFQSRPPLRYLPPTDFAPENRTTGRIDGLAAFTEVLKEEPLSYEATESWVQKKDRERLEKLEASKKLVTEDVKNCTALLLLSIFIHSPLTVNPKEDPNVKGDPFKTLFVGRLDYKTGEQQLKGIFRKYGPIVRVRGAQSHPGFLLIPHIDTHTRERTREHRREEEKSTPRIWFH